MNSDSISRRLPTLSAPAKVAVTPELSGNEGFPTARVPLQPTVRRAPTDLLTTSAAQVDFLDITPLLPEMKKINPVYGPQDRPGPIAPRRGQGLGRPEGPTVEALR